MKTAEEWVHDIWNCGDSEQVAVMQAAMDEARAEATQNKNVDSLLRCASDWAADGQTLTAWIEHAKYRHVDPAQGLRKVVVGKVEYVTGPDKEVK